MKKSNKKICILTSVHPPFDTRIFHKEAKTLANAGYNVTLITKHNKKEEKNGIKIIPLKQPKNRFERLTKTDYSLYKKALKQNADIYHFHDPELLPWMVRLKKKIKGEVIYDIHENIREQILKKEWIPYFLKKIFSKVYSFIEKKLLSQIDWILLAEYSYKKIYSEYSNKTTIRNYPIIRGDKSNKIKGDNLKNLVYVGGVTKERGVFEMIKATHILKEEYKKVKTTIAGPIQQKIKTKINGSIKSLNLENNISLLGRLPHHKALKLISNSNIGLALLHPTPNYKESLPTKIFEYMMMGLPIVTSNFPLWEKIVERNNCGVCVDPTKPQEIAQVIKYLINHPEVATRKGKNGKEAVLKKYNWKNESKKLLETYEKLSKK